MTLNRYSLLTIFCYGLAFFIPAFFADPNQAVLATTLSYLIGAVVMILLYVYQKEPLKIEKNTASKLSILIWGIVGIFIALILQNIAANIEGLFGELQPSQNTQNIITIILQRPIFAVAVMIGGPIMEEFVFRRALFGILAKYSNYWIGLILSSLAFAFAHNDGHLLVYFFLGSFFLWLYTHTGKIWTSIITHVGMNTLVVIVQIALAQ